MNRLWRRLRLLVAVVVSITAGTLPACGTMGGGGMHFGAEPPSASAPG